MIVKNTIYFVIYSVHSDGRSMLLGHRTRKNLNVDTVLFTDKMVEIFHSGMSQRDDIKWKMSILLRDLTAVFILVKGPLNKLAFLFKNIIS